MKLNKTLVALTLASVAAPSMAEVVLYGKIKAGVEVSETKLTTVVNGRKVTTNETNGTETKIVDYGSRIGFRGQEKLDGDLTAIWQMEQKVDIGGTSGNGFGTRDSFIGLKGDSVGTLKAGYLSTPTKDLNGRLDEWDYSNDALGLATFTRSSDASKRAVAVSYTTPNLAGFKATAYVSPSDNNHNQVGVVNGTSTPNTNKADTSTYGLSLNYENSGFFADVAGVYVKNGVNNGSLTYPNSHGHNQSVVIAMSDKKAYQALVQAGYENDSFLVGVAAQRSQHVDKDYDVVNEVTAHAGVNLGDGLRLKGSAAYGFKITPASGNAAGVKHGKGEYYQGIIGADYSLSKRTVLNAQAGYLEYRPQGNNQSKTRTTAFGVGLVHKF